MQIYNEDIIDLLAEDNNQKLETDDSFLVIFGYKVECFNMFIFMHRVIFVLQRGPYVVGLREETVKSIDQVLGLFQEGFTSALNVFNLFTFRINFTIFIYYHIGS